MHARTHARTHTQTRVYNIYAGVTFSLALSTEGLVYSWGQGDMRQLGHGWNPEVTSW